ncbi:unnamed protein product [Acanthoscelides obtectus]|uniref:Uncharacterized protein n=2 Tax=Acanthoscelides obtectus TaxID=200917 RepID=A0A9P0K6R9_ACAOB|nr:unnamed protein product [Acanthoscelides obtectus]CAK1683157.1 hypothetical protein AOBTE_LOCUS34110 [Acanthoscelides obtectus]
MKEKVNEANFDDPDFDYVVEIKEGEKICFGSTIPRSTAPIGKDLAPNQKRITPENFPNIAPGKYNSQEYTSAMYKTLHKIRSRKGVGPLASKDSRFKEKITFRTPSPGRYEIRAKPDMTGKQWKAPFLNSSKVREMDIDDNPGPGTYDLKRINKSHRTRYVYNFGHPEMIHCVETVCVSKPQDSCMKCEKLCEGDYWHKEYSTFLCQMCWYEERMTQETFTEKELKEFKKIRNCSFMHDHEKTTAALKILPQNKINKKIRLENYLDMYIKC